MTDPDPNAPKASESLGPTSVAPTSDLFHSSSSGQRATGSWLWVALPVAGLLVVPMVGLIYAATSSFGHGTAPSASGVTIVDPDEPDLDGDLATRGTATAKTPARAARRTPKVQPPTKQRSDGAATCCAKLSELGKSAPLDSRGTYLAAARLCEAADDEVQALKQARSAIGAARGEVPPECAP